jgi:hypothetical protein
MATANIAHTREIRVCLSDRLPVRQVMRRLRGQFAVGSIRYHAEGSRKLPNGYVNKMSWEIKWRSLAFWFEGGESFATRSSGFEIRHTFPRVASRGLHFIPHALFVGGKTRGPASVPPISDFIRKNVGLEPAAARAKMRDLFGGGKMKPWIQIRGISGLANGSPHLCRSLHRDEIDSHCRGARTQP